MFPEGPTCGNRTIKNIEYIKRIASHLLPKENQLESITKMIPAEVLMKLHTISNFQEVVKNKELADLLEKNPPPRPNIIPASPLFQGTLYFVQITFNTPTGSILAISNNDLQTAINYVRNGWPIAWPYISQYGNFTGVSASSTTLTVSLPSNSYNDSTLQGWVNNIASQPSAPNNPCVVILQYSNLSVSNNTASPATFFGYHSFANVPYIFCYVYGQPNTLDLKDNQGAYAGTLSHELTEMVVDPNPIITQNNPEVCDPCDLPISSRPCAVRWYDFFKVINGDARFIGAYQYNWNNLFTPPPFDYDYYINSIIKPRFYDYNNQTGCANCTTLTQSADPRAACAYSFSSLTSWSYQPNGDEHVVGLRIGQVGLSSNNATVGEVYFRPSVGQWQYGGISNNTPALPNLYPSSSLTSWIAANGDEHVVGIGVDGTVIEFLYPVPNGPWRLSGISNNTPPAPAPKLFPGSGLTSWVKYIEPDIREHVVGIGPDGTVHDFFYDANLGHWQSAPISNNTTALPNLFPSSSLTSWIDTAGGVQAGNEHVVGIGPDGQVHEYWYDLHQPPPHPWQRTGITDPQDPVNWLPPGSSLTSWIEDNGNEHVVGVRGDGTLVEYLYTPSVGHWSPQPWISHNTPALPNLVPGSSLTSFIDRVGGQHVVGLGVDGAVLEFFSPPSGPWQLTGISNNADVPNLFPGSSLTSWIEDNGDEHVVGLGANGTIYEFFYRASVGHWQLVSNISQQTGINFS